MDDLVLDFQETVANVFAPPTRRQGAVAAQQDAFQAQLVLAYYPWCQEFFCDAIGLRIGGPCFLRAFASYFRLQGTHAFYVPRARLVLKEHPVGWLRIRSLLCRARRTGLEEVAAKVENDWHATARLLRVTEDYEGTWSDELSAPLDKMLDDMVEEAGARGVLPEEAEATELAPGSSVVGLLNASWRRFEQDGGAYAKEEHVTISRIETGAGN
jgi:hypothetical protein